MKIWKKAKLTSNLHPRAHLGTDHDYDWFVRPQNVIYSID